MNIPENEIREKIQKSINSFAKSLDINEAVESSISSDREVHSRLVSKIRSLLHISNDQRVYEADVLEKLLELNGIFYRQSTINSALGFHQVVHLRFEAKTKTIYLAYYKNGNYVLYNPIDDTLVKGSDCRADLLTVVYELFPLLPENLKSRFDLLKFLWPAIKNDFLASSYLSFFLALLALTYPYITSRVLDDVVPSGNLILILNAFIVGLLIASFNGFFSWLKNYFVYRANTSLALRIKVAAYNWFLSLPVNQLSTFTNGDLGNRVDELETVAESISSGLINSAANAFMVCGYAFLMFFYDINLAIFVIIFIAISSAPIIILNFRSSVYVERVESSSGELKNFSLEILGSLVQIRSAGAEPFVLQKWISSLKQLTGDEFRSQRQSDFISVLASAISSSGQVFIYLVILWRLWNAESLTDALIATTTFIVFVGSYNGFESSFGSLINEILTQLVSVSVRWKRVRELLELKESHSAQIADTTFIDKSEVNGGFSFRQVAFSYPNQSLPLFESLNFELKARKINSIFGPSGCGKSTIFKLLLRLDKPSHGSILMDDKPLNDFYLKDYRRLFGVVLQKTTLPGGSLRDAIAGGINCTDEEIWQALEMANVHQEVYEMPMQLYTVLSEGGMNISGGQRQRISIARALIRKPSILLEDEATSALDNESQNAISNNLLKLGITRVVIAHRISAVAQSDHMVIIKNGQVEAQGSYNQLLNESEYLQSVVNRPKS